MTSLKCFFLLRSTFSMTFSNSTYATTVTMFCERCSIVQLLLLQVEMSFEEIQAEVICVKGVALSGKDVHVCLDVLLVVKNVVSAA